MSEGAAPVANPKPETASPARVATPPQPAEFPPFTKNLLRVKVKVMVTLAQKKQPVRSIIELVPGSIIQFDKACDEMLDLEVCGQPTAQGECIKVGDKFGLRVTSIVLPEERFRSLKAPGK